MTTDAEYRRLCAARAPLVLRKFYGPPLTKAEQLRLITINGRLVDLEEARYAPVVAEWARRIAEREQLIGDTDALLAECR